MFVTMLGNRNIKNVRDIFRETTKVNTFVPPLAGGLGGPGTIHTVMDF